MKRRDFLLSCAALAVGAPAVLAGEEQPPYTLFGHPYKVTEPPKCLVRLHLEIPKGIGSTSSPMTQDVTMRKDHAVVLMDALAKKQHVYAKAGDMKPLRVLTMGLVGTATITWGSS